MKLSIDSQTLLRSGEPTVAPDSLSRIPAINKPLDGYLSGEMSAWMEAMSLNMKRMSQDENYRQEIAKLLF